MAAVTWQAVAASIAAGALVVYLVRHLFKYGWQKGSFIVFPVLGLAPDFMWHFSRMFDHITEVLESSPSMSALGFDVSRDWFFTANPEHLEYILKTNTANFPKGEDFKSVVEELLGDGIFTSDGDSWKSQRKTASYEFSTNSLRSLMLNSIQSEIQERLLPALDWVVQNRKTVDLQDVLLRFGLDNILQVAFGVDPHALSLTGRQLVDHGLSTDTALSGSRPDQMFPDVPFGKSVESVLQIMALRAALPHSLWKAVRALGWGPEAQLAKEMKVVDKFVAEVIAKRREELKKAQEKEALLPAASSLIAEAAGISLTGAHEAKPEAASINGPEPKADSEQNHYGSVSRGHGTGAGRTDILSRFITAGEKQHSQAFTDAYLRDNVLSFLIAGRDTSAVALTWFFWEVSRHPDVETKLVKEIDSIVGATGRDPEAPLSFEELKRMTYAHAALNESMRLHAPVPMDQKMVVEDDVLPGGNFVGKGWRLTYCIYAVGRMSRVWGPDANEFKPERWIGADGELKVVSPFQFVMFNAGPRLCLGKDMAYMQMKSVVGNLMRRYRVQVQPGHKATYTPSITLVMKGGLPVTLTRREGGL